LVRVDDTALAGAGNDKITVGGTGIKSSTVVGGEGKDSLYLGTGNALYQGSYGLNDGNDYLSLTAEGLTIRNASFGLNDGTDKLLASQTGMSMSFTTIGGGKLADTITLSAGNISNSQILAGGGADVIFGGTGLALATTTLNSGDGHDKITMSSGGSSTFVLAAGAGYDKLTLTDVAAKSIAGGSGNDTISLTRFGGGKIYGDGLGKTTSVGAAQAADRITAAAGISAATSIYGAGGADTINFADVSAVSVLVDGGYGADLIGSTALKLLTGGALTLAGGDGHDTIKFASSETGGLNLLGGAGIDSIYIAASATGSVNGGAGNDTINFSAFATQLSGLGSLTIQGGAGNDQILLGQISAGLLLSTGADLEIISSMAGNVVYSAGDSVLLKNSTLPAAALTSVYVLSAKNVLTAIAAVTGTGKIMGVYTDTDDLVFVVRNGADTSTAYDVFRAIGGSGAVNTTATGAQNLVASNFDFTLANSGSGMTITFG
jgi:Ca2+-binding RTX toxin-like protein